MKKILSFAAALAFAVAMSGCGQSASENNAGGDTQTSEEPAMHQDAASDTLQTNSPADTVQN